MKTTTIIEPSDIKYIKIDVGPRYWEDGEINGKDDISWEEQSKGNKPNMPFAVFNEDRAKIRRSESYRWVLTIDVDNLKILDWPQGISANIHYKVCDDGTYFLMDKDKNVLEEKECYVPDILCYLDSGYGDYIIMHIGENGELENFPLEYKNDLLQKLIDTESF